MECPCALKSAISSRSANDRYRPESGFAEALKIDGGMPPAFRNNLYPASCGNPALPAASSLLKPAAIPRQNLSCSARPATGGRPAEPSGARVDRFLRIGIATSKSRALRRPIESASGIPCAAVLTLIRDLPGVPGLLATVIHGIITRELSASVGAPGPHDFTSASMPLVWQHLHVHRIPASRVVTIARNAPPW
jgi:hypothetical protein